MNRYSEFIKQSGLHDSVKWVLNVNARMFFIHLNYDFDECWFSGLVAAIEALKDGEITSDGNVSKGAKRHIRRQMALNAPTSKLTGVPKIDYKYVDGRTTKRGTQGTPKNKHVRYTANMRKQGKCPRCGKKPEEDLVLCNRCRQKMKKRKAEAQRRYMQKVYGEMTMTPMEKKMREVIREDWE